MLFPELLIEIIEYDESVLFKFLELNKKTRELLLKEINSGFLKTKRLHFLFDHSKRIPEYIRAITWMRIFLSKHVPHKLEKSNIDFSNFSGLWIEENLKRENCFRSNSFNRMEVNGIICDERESEAKRDTIAFLKRENNGNSILRHFTNLKYFVLYMPNIIHFLFDLRNFENIEILRVHQRPGNPDVCMFPKSLKKLEVFHYLGECRYFVDLSQCTRLKDVNVECNKTPYKYFSNCESVVIGSDLKNEEKDIEYLSNVRHVNIGSMQDKMSENSFEKLLNVESLKIWIGKKVTLLKIYEGLTAEIFTKMKKLKHLNLKVERLFWNPNNEMKLFECSDYSWTQNLVSLKIDELALTATIMLADANNSKLPNINEKKQKVMFSKLRSIRIHDIFCNDGYADYSHMRITNKLKYFPVLSEIEIDKRVIFCEPDMYDISLANMVKSARNAKNTSGNKIKFSFKKNLLKICVHKELKTKVCVE